jgi:hypothetical protein
MNLTDTAVLGLTAFGGAATGIALVQADHQTRAVAALLWLGLACGTAAVALFAVSL